MQQHQFPIRVYFEDTDTAGVVYYANYLKFAERARTEMRRAHGIDHSHLIEHDNITFVVRRCEVDYLKPAKLDDELMVTTKVLSLDKIRMHLQQTISSSSDTLVDMTVQLVCINGTGRPTRIPTQIIEKLGR